MTDSRSELMALADEIQSALALVLNWPEKRCDGLPEGELGRVFMDLLAVRNLAQKAEKALRLAASQPQPDREMVARIIDPEAWSIDPWNNNWRAVIDKRQTRAFDKADAILLLLVGGDQKKLTAEGKHQTEQSGKQLSPAWRDVADALAALQLPEAEIQRSLADELEAAANWMQLYLDTYGELGDDATQASIDDWHDAVKHARKSGGFCS